jgi:hypothetical protein
VRRLGKGKLPHLSYSKIVSHEYCPQKYFLEYVRKLRIKLEPSYFIDPAFMQKCHACQFKTLCREQPGPEPLRPSAQPCSA